MCGTEDQGQWRGPGPEIRMQGVGRMVFEEKCGGGGWRGDSGVKRASRGYMRDVCVNQSALCWGVTP